MPRCGEWTQESAEPWLLSRAAAGLSSVCPSAHGRKGRERGSPGGLGAMPGLSPAAGLQRLWACRWAPPHSPQNPVPIDDLIQLTAMCWLREFIQLAGRVMLPYSSGILTAVLPCLAYDDRKRSILQPRERRQGQP